MKRGQQLGWVILVGGSLLAFAGCSDDDDSSTGGGGSAAHAGSSSGGDAQGGAASSDGTDECKVMGELCHEADTGSGGAGSAAHECHEVGHEGDGTACLKEFAGCINTCVDEAPANLSLADARCASLGELCHPVDDKTGRLHECHLLGEAGDVDTCASNFADCAERCLAAREHLEAGGEGGAGGASGHSHEHGGAGGVGGASDATAAGTSGSAG